MCCCFRLLLSWWGGISQIMAYIKFSFGDDKIVCNTSQVTLITGLHHPHEPWWRHQMETFSALLAIWAGNSPVNSPHKGQWRGALIFSLICAWINGWVNNREAGDLRRHRAHYDVTVMPLNVPASETCMALQADGKPSNWTISSYGIRLTTTDASISVYLVSKCTDNFNLFCNVLNMFALKILYLSSIVFQTS